MKKIISATSLSLLIAAAAALVPTVVLAQSPSAAGMSDGEVRKVDKDARKITLRHGEIKNLNMPAMTMVFQVKDPSMLDKVKAGDKVKFKAVNASGTLTVTQIESAQ